MNSVRNEERERLPTRSQNEVTDRVWQQVLQSFLMKYMPSVLQESKILEGGEKGAAFFISESLRDLENLTFYTRRWAKNGARCLDGVRGSRPLYLYTMIAWLLQTCTYHNRYISVILEVANKSRNMLQLVLYKTSCLSKDSRIFSNGNHWNKQVTVGKAIRCMLPRFVGKRRFCAVSNKFAEIMLGPTMSKNHLNTEALTTDFVLRTSGTRYVSSILPASS